MEEKNLKEIETALIRKLGKGSGPEQVYTWVIHIKDNKAVGEEEIPKEWEINHG